LQKGSKKGKEGVKGKKFFLLFLLFLPFLLPSSPMLLALSQSNPAQDQTFVWTKQASGVLARLTAVYFSDDQNGWAAGSNGVLLKTADGGASWLRQPLPPQFSRDLLRDLSLPDAQQIRLLGEYNLQLRPTSEELDARSFVLASADGGGGWRNVELARPPDKPPKRARRQAANKDADDEVKRLSDPILLGFHFSNAQTGWAVGESGAIQATRDGGASWQMQYAATRKLFYDVTAIDEQQAWIVGAGGVVLRTVDGGHNWGEQASGTTQTLRAAQFIGAKHGWAAGANGTVIATTNGGLRWQAQNTGSTETLNDVFFVNPREGWLAGDRGTLLHTRDGGASWQDESRKTVANLNRLFFVAPACGWVVGANGAIYKYAPAAPPRPAVKSK
jgi:photosystem II stability/assembly factor-like uncharacterized protein